MKRVLAAFLFVALASVCWGQTPGDEVNTVSQQLSAARAKRADFGAQGKVLDAKKGDIQFAYDAWVKGTAVHKEELATYNRAISQLDEEGNRVAAQRSDLGARTDAHNGNRCTAPEDNPGACNWYNNEASALNAEKSQVDASFAALLARKTDLDGQADTLNGNADKLDQIIKQVSADTLDWVAKQKQLLADWDDNERQIKHLEELLNVLKSQFGACTDAIPAECERPDSQLLNDKCAKMHAACGQIFDGNR